MKNLMPTKSSRNFYNTNHDAKEIHSIVRRPRHTLFFVVADGVPGSGSKGSESQSFENSEPSTAAVITICNHTFTEDKYRPNCSCYHMKT
jgi:hypothetical protein